MTDKILPQNIEAEQAVLGAILIEGKAISQVLEILTPDDFYKEAHKKIYQSMLDMNEQVKPIDILTLFDYLKSQGQLLEEVGGSSYLTYLTELVPSTANVSYYARLVKEKEIERKICEISEEMDVQLRDGQITYQQAIEKIELMLEKLSNQQLGNRIPFVSSDVLITQDADSLEWYIDGLIPRGAVVLLTAPPGLWKTWLAMHIGLVIAKGENFLGRKSSEATVYYIDKENPKSLIANRLKKLGTDENLKFWGYWSEIEPPNLDKLATYKTLAKDNTILTFDSLIRFHSGDENSSQDMSKVMGALRSLTKDGATVIGLHHKGKSDFAYRGSSDILGAVDICYTLEKEKENLLKLSCRAKNRLTQEFDLFIEIKETEGRLSFCLADSPKHVEEEADLERLKQVIKGIIDEGLEPIQTIIIERGKSAIGFSKDKTLKLLDKCEGMIWRKETGSTSNKKIYRLIDDGFRLFGDIYTSEKQKSEIDPWDEVEI